MKEGNIVKFHTAFPDEDPNQLFVILEVMKGENSRAKIKALNTGSGLAPVTIVNLEDLVIAEVLTKDLLGQYVTILCEGNNYKTGKVESAESAIINLELNKSRNVVHSNVRLKILDATGNEHQGYLCVK